MSNTTVTNAIRAELKAAGFNARQVSVKDRHYGDIKVTVRDIAVPLSAVEAIAMKHQNIRRCESSGEILCGGNTSVEVVYDRNVIAPVAEAIAAIISSTECGYQAQLAGGYRATRYSDSPWHVQVRAHGPGLDNLICYGVDHAANQIAAKYLDQRALAAREQAAQAA